MNKKISGLAVLVVVVLALPAAYAASANNISILYGWNGTSFVPATITNTGALLTTINMSQSMGLSPQLNNTYDLGTAARIWANLYVRSIRGSGPVSIIGDANITGTLYVTGLVGDGSNLTNIGANLSLNYGYNGTNWLPLATTADGTLRLSVRDSQATNASQLTSGATGSDLTLTGHLIAATANITGGLNVSAGGFNVVGGNVGIGTTGPNALLNLKTSGTASQAGLFIDKSDNQRIVSLGSDSSAGGYIDIRDNAQTQKIFLAGLGNSWFNAGNVGIGTTSPNNKLTVVGAVNATSFIGDGSNISNMAYGTVNGRLTLESGVPVSTSDQSSKTIIFFTPYKGNQIGLYNNSVWSLLTFTEINLSLAGYTASKPYDIFAYNNGSVVALESLVWTSGTARATALTTQNGILVKSGDATRRYLGTVYINSNGGQSDDTSRKRFIFNMYNRVMRELRYVDPTGSWAYSTFTWRQANANTANQFEVMVGISEETLFASLDVLRQQNAYTVSMHGWGYDVTNDPSAYSSMAYLNNLPASGIPITGTASISIVPAIGYHYAAWIEKAEASGGHTAYGAGYSLMHGGWTS